MLTSEGLLATMNVLSPPGRFLINMKIITYLRETKTELKHVIWPTRQQAILLTIAVLLISGILAYLLGLFDFLFSKGLETILPF
jgi:preprotein translocase subunit SecE